MTEVLPARPAARLPPLKKTRFRLSSESLATPSYARYGSSTPDIAQLTQRQPKRRFSLLDMIKRKSSVSLNQQGIEMIEEDVFNEESQSDDQNEKLLISFADIYGGHEGQSHENRLFQLESPEHNDQAVSFFGKKGKAKGEFQDAKDITILSGNRLLITDLINSRLQLCNASGRLLLMYSGSDVAEPWGTSCIDNKTVAVTSRKNRCVRVLDLDGEVTNTFGETFFSCPTGLAIDHNGHFIICDSGANTVSVHSRDGMFVRYLGDNSAKHGRFSSPRYACVSNKGDIIISDSGNHKIKVFNSSYEFVRSFGSFGKGDGQLKSPYGVCTNKLGDIIVADHYNNRISMFTCKGAFIRHLVTSEHGLRHPQGLAIKSGNTLFVSHGDLKACEILVYTIECQINSNDSEIVCHL